MRNILVDEYAAELSVLAARWGADGGAGSGRALDAVWSAPLGGCHVSVELRWHLSNKFMTVSAQIGQFWLPMGDAHVTARILRDVLETIDKALAVQVSFSGVRVYTRDCPCGYCGARGVTSGRQCSTCGGTGYRQPKETT